MFRNKILVLAAAAALLSPGLRAETTIPAGERHPAALVADVTAAEIFHNYIKAIGGADALKAVRTLNSDLTMTIQGMALDVKIKAMAPNLEAMTMSGGGTVYFQSRFDGTTGYQEQNGARKPYADEQLKEKAQITGLFEQLDYLRNPAFKAVVKGIEPVKGADAYRVEITYPTGSVKTEFYDVKSKLLVQKIETRVQDGISVTTKQDYSNYKAIGKVLYPHDAVLTVSANGQDQVMELKTMTVKFNEGVTEADFK